MLVEFQDVATIIGWTACIMSEQAMLAGRQMINIKSGGQRGVGHNPPELRLQGCQAQCQDRLSGRHCRHGHLLPDSLRAEPGECKGTLLPHLPSGQCCRSCFKGMRSSVCPSACLLVGELENLQRICQFSRTCPLYCIVVSCHLGAAYEHLTRCAAGRNHCQGQ